MTNANVGTSTRQAAIVVGVGLLLMAVAAVFATDVVLGRLVVPGDAMATTVNIATSEMLFRAGIFSWLVILVCDVLVAWGLYVFFRKVAKSLALLMAWLRLAYVFMLAAAMFGLVAVMVLVTGNGWAAFGIDLMPAQVQLFLDAFNDMWSVGLVVFGLHILVLGYLALKSSHIPKFFGVLLVISFFGYVVTHSGNLLCPDYETYGRVLGMIFIAPMVVGEVGLGVWLLFRGGRARRTDSPAG